MNYNDLISSNFCIYLVEEIESADLSNCSNDELCFLKKMAESIKERADTLTLEEEFVGYTYYNLDALNPKITKETAKRKMKAIQSGRV